MTFQVGQDGEIRGVDWRVVKGWKSPGDLRLEIRAFEFVPPSMALGFLFADFYAQNERTLSLDGYLAPKVAANAGARYLHFVKGAQLLGWEVAADQLQRERQRKNGRAA